ncbi:MAG: hypothetical protein AABY16_01360 [Nanoarchaeota archaeon]
MKNKIWFVWLLAIIALVSVIWVASFSEGQSRNRCNSPSISNDACIGASLCSCTVGTSTIYYQPVSGSCIIASAGCNQGTSQSLVTITLNNACAAALSLTKQQQAANPLTCTSPPAGSGYTCVPQSSVSKSKFDHITKCCNNIFTLNCIEKKDN